MRLDGSKVLVMMYQSRELYERAYEHYHSLTMHRSFKLLSLFPLQYA